MIYYRRVLEGFVYFYFGKRGQFKKIGLQCSKNQMCNDKDMKIYHKHMPQVTVKAICWNIYIHCNFIFFVKLKLTFSKAKNLIEKKLYR